jgi:rubrerythrin
MPALSARTVLRWALEIETNGEAFYKAVAEAASDRDVRTLFNDLAYQEERHYRTFERMLAQVQDDSAVKDDPKEFEAYIRAALADALVGGSDKGLELAKQAANEEAALKAAMAFEKDTLLFFYDVRDMVPEAQQETMTAIIDQEKDHLRQLARVLEAGPWVT